MTGYLGERSSRRPPWIVASFVLAGSLNASETGLPTAPIPLTSAFTRSDVVAKVAITSAESETFNLGGRFVVEARVVRAFKGAKDEDRIYFDASFASHYALNTRYLLFLLRGGKTLGDASSKAFSNVPRSRFPGSAELLLELRGACELPIVASRLEPEEYVQAERGCIELPIEWKARTMEVAGGSVAVVGWRTVEQYLSVMSKEAK